MIPGNVPASERSPPDLPAVHFALQFQSPDLLPHPTWVIQASNTPDRGTPNPKEAQMVRFVSLFNFTEQGIRGYGETVARADKFTKDAQKAGAKVVALYW